MKPQDFTDAEAQQILARAVQLDTTPPDRLDVDQIRAIAAELGVSQSALDRALAEHSTDARAVVPSTEPVAARQRWYCRPGPLLAFVAAILFATIVGLSLVVEVPDVRADVERPTALDVRVAPRQPTPR